MAGGHLTIYKGVMHSRVEQQAAATQAQRLKCQLLHLHFSLWVWRPVQIYQALPQLNVVCLSVFPQLIHHKLDPQRKSKREEAGHVQQWLCMQSFSCCFCAFEDDLAASGPKCRGPNGCKRHHLWAAFRIRQVHNSTAARDEQSALICCINALRRSMQSIMEYSCNVVNVVAMGGSNALHDIFSHVPLL